MTLYEVLLLNEKEEKTFFFNLMQGFTKDYKIFGEDTYKIYSDVFGNEELFEEVQNNIEVIKEELNFGEVILEQSNEYLDELKKRWAARDAQFNASPNTKTIEKILPDGTKATIRVGTIGAHTETDYTPRKPVGIPTSSPPPNSATTAAAAATATNVAKKGAVAATTTGAVKTVAGKSGSFLSKIFEGAKKWISGLAAKFPKLAGVVQKGIGWITANPLAVAGIAGGTILLGKLIKTLKSHGEEKKAAKLQAAIDQAKGAK